MSKITDQLRHNERILWQGKPELKPYVFGGFKIIPFGAGLLLVFISLGYLVPLTISKEFAKEFVLATGFLLFIGLALTFLTIFYSRYLCRTTEYLVTDQRIVIRTYASDQDIRVIPFYEAGGVNVDISPIDSISGTGSIFVENPGSKRYQNGGTITFPDIRAIKKPYKVQKIIQDAIKDYKSKSQNSSW